MSERLDELVEATRRRLAERKHARSLAELERALPEEGIDRPFAEALSRPGTSVIGEYKRRSPSAGDIRPGASVTDLVRAYERGGAAAVSVLTEEDHFGGSLDDLREARAATDLPILRKDFTIDPYQVYEAKVYGADAVLLVVGALSDSLLGSLYGIARQLELDAIVEVHDEEELERALEVDADVIGINNRNLVDFSVDLGVTFELLTDVPAGKTVVSESGIHTRADVDELEGVGVDAVLVGEALMRAPDPEAACRDLAREEEPTQA
ncbi:MAG: indole-3-glycerol phosphate synthase [Thermoleophilaceae bacterium]|nr:indole-3-glycerol phosphate synthase [Thermoleophilaceae bacterium]MEA2470566.1 indole-3-glycerol phosphate synthase [Thermoleophilaceae bacterium]